VYRIRFERPVDYELVFSLDFLTLSPRKKDDHALLFLLCKEGISKDAIKDYHERMQTVNRFVVAALIQSEPVVQVIRRALKRLAPDSKVDQKEVAELLPDVLKRDVVEGESAAKARRQVQRAAQKSVRRASTSEAPATDTPN
jgi:hypothetical protein